MKGKLTSIIIPAYKASNFLEDCIKSIINQNIEKEVIVGVDGCLNTLHFILSNKIIKENCKIYYFGKNVGTYLVMNSLIKHSSHENIIFFGADDWMCDDIISEASDSLLNFDMVRWQYYNFIDSSKIQYKSKSYAPGAFAVRKELLIKLNAFFPWRISADCEFQFRAEHKKATTFLSNKCFFRRIHNENMTVREDTGMESEIRKSYTAHIQKLMKEKTFENPERLFTSNCILISKPKNND